MTTSPTRLCPRCGSVVGLTETYCRRCGAEVQGGRVEGPSVRYELGFNLLHVTAGIFAALMWILARGSDLELCGGALFAVVLVSLAVHYRRRPQYRVIKARRRVRHLLKNPVAVFASANNPLSGRSVRIQGRVVWVAEVHHDEIIIRTDLPVTTTGNQRSDLLALVPAESGDSFASLLDLGRMSVRIWLVDRSYLSVGRGNLLARRSLRLNPPIPLGRGVALFEPASRSRWPLRGAPK